MDAFANFLFVAISGATLGAAIVGAAVRVRLFRRTADKGYLMHAAFETGYAMTTGTLLWVVTGTGVTVSGRFWAYMVGAVLAAVGLAGVTLDTIQQEAEKET